MNRKDKNIICLILIIFMIALSGQKIWNNQIVSATTQVESIAEKESEVNISLMLKETESIKQIETSQEIIEETTEIRVLYIEMDTPLNNSFKAYMDYRCITDKTSNQWILQKQAYTDEYTGLRMIADRYCIAVGSYYTVEIGTYLDLVMDNGEILKCILADCKADIHTDSETHRANLNGGIAEFVVDKNIIVPLLTSTYGNSGNVSDLADRFKGEIKFIRVYE